MEKDNQNKIPVSVLFCFTPEELIKKGYTIQQLKEAGFTHHILKDFKKTNSKKEE